MTQFGKHAVMQAWRCGGIGGNSGVRLPGGPRGAQVWVGISGLGWLTGLAR
jgi:hypothetical protein